MSQTKTGDRTMQGERLGLDSAKRSFQGHGVAGHGKVVIRKHLRRGKGRGHAETLRAWVGDSYGPGSGRFAPGDRRTAPARVARSHHSVYVAACRISSRRPPVEWICMVPPSYCGIPQPRRPG
jgi:hypothetical protein